MTNDTSFVTALRPFFSFVSVIWVTRDSYFLIVPKESKKHILRREGISADVLTQEAVFEFTTRAGCLQCDENKIVFLAMT